ncbi:uncharacterized protein TNCV_2363871 [Trichonephila clavipes]|nr:uncharacterized protein TNCV_2363871 [Trichonephila clavipes]
MKLNEYLVYCNLPDMTYLGKIFYVGLTLSKIKIKKPTLQKLATFFKRNIAFRTALCVLLLHRGCGSPVVKVSDYDRHVMSTSPVPLKTRRVRKRCTLHLPRAQTSSRWCGSQEREVPAQLSFSSLDHGSKLRGPSLKPLL